MNSALIVDDEPDIRELLELTLTRMGLETFSAANVKEAKHALSTQTFSVCLTDMRLPDGDGLEVIEHIQAHHACTPVAMITAHGNMDTAITAMKLGAFDFVSKPIELTQLRSMVTHALNLSRTAGVTPPSVEKEPLEIPDSTSSPDHIAPKIPDPTSHALPLLIGSSPAMQRLGTLIKKVARSQASVYIHGESGTGKELVAKSLHHLSSRAQGPFIPVNCSAIPSELLESEFFGHIKGSFTGATNNKDGLFKAAHNGTLFLDEVADLPVSMQVKLLRAIQEKSIRPVGAHAEEQVDVRILSASHKDLAQLVDEGKFRQDLFYRINVIRIDVPPLRAREQDTLEITQHILNKISQRDGITPPLHLTGAAQNALLDHAFPGNVRELENTLERASALCTPPEVDIDDLQLPSFTAVNTTPLNANTQNLSLTQELEQTEKEEIRQALIKTKGNKTAAAKLLGLSFRQLRYRVKKLGL